MRILSFTSVALLIPLCLAQEQNPLGYSGPSPPTSDDNHTHNPLTESFNRRVEWALKHFHIPGLAISVVHNGTTFAKGYGLSSLTPSTPVTPNTLFFAGSTTKAHTAAAISLLVDDNTNYPNIQWSTPLHSLLPDFALSDPLYTAQVTLEDMLSHRSGLPRHDTVFMQNITAREIVHRMRYLPLTAPVRSEWQYCNLMYVAAGQVIEHATGVTLETFLRENLWRKLGMHDTGFEVLEALRRGEDVAEGYWYEPTSTSNPNSTSESESEFEFESEEGIFHPTNKTFNPALHGAGNILTSASSYAKWIAALLTRSPPISSSGYASLFGAHSIMTPVASPPFSAPDLYGFGWMVQSYKGQTVVQHGGAQDGFGAFVVLLPEKEVGFAILGNNMLGTSAACPILVFELVDALLGVPAEERFDWEGLVDEKMRQLELTNSTLEKLYPDLPSVPDLLPLPLNISSYVGMYTHPAYPSFNISEDCPERGVLYNPEKWTGTRLCASFHDTVTMSSDLALDFFHVTGAYWTVVIMMEKTNDAMRAEFGITSGGVVSRLGVEFDMAMRARGEKLWFERA